MQQGILYCAIGEDHYQRAERSALSAKRHIPDMVLAVYTDQRVTDGIWDAVLKAEVTDPSVQPMIYKLNAILASPFDETLYLDADTLVLDDISEMFALLQRFDLAYCHGHMRQKRYNLQHGFDRFNGAKGRPVVDTSIPYSFSPLQGGVLLFSKLRTMDFFEEVKKQFLEVNYFDDQAIMRNVLWSSNIRPYVLAPEYNIYSIDYLEELKEGHFAQAIPKIFHYTEHKDTDIEGLIRSVYNDKKVEKHRRASNQSLIKHTLQVVKNFLHR